MVTRMPVGAQPHKPKVLAKEAATPAPQPKLPDKGDASKPESEEKPSAASSS
jgi:hypothetical protein